MIIWKLSSEIANIISYITIFLRGVRFWFF